jgi:hypothetical protein
MAVPYKLRRTGFHTCRLNGLRKDSADRDIRPTAHSGILFLDEFPEFVSRVLEVLRQPVEDKILAISRIQGSLTLSANIRMVAAMYPWAYSSI